MHSYLILLRGINVGGKNKISMAELRSGLEDLNCTDVRTYINSGNVLLQSSLSANQLKDAIETMLPQKFKLDSSLIKVLVLTAEQLQKIISEKPTGFGEQPETFHSDVIFLIDANMDDVKSIFNPRDGVDKIWFGDTVIYSQRLSAERTKSRLGKIIGTPAYQSMTIRSWNTVTKLLSLFNRR